MEAFKNRLQHRIYGGALYCCIMVFVFVLLAEAVPENRYAGLLLVILLVSEAAVLGRMAMLAATLKKEDSLKKLYIREQDERPARIREKAAGTAVSISAAVLTLAALAAGYVDRTVSLTLLGADLLVILLYFGLKWYYSRKF